MRTKNAGRRRLALLLWGAVLSAGLIACTKSPPPLTEEDYQAFLEAVDENKLAAAREWLEKRVDVNRLIPDGFPRPDWSFVTTPLYTACLYQHREMVKLLLDHGADPTILTSMGLPIQSVLGADGNEAAEIVTLLEAYLKEHPGKSRAPTDEEVVLGVNHPRGWQGHLYEDVVVNGVSISAETRRKLEAQGMKFRPDELGDQPMFLTIKRSAERVDFRWDYRPDGLAGSFSSGCYRLEHGFWIHEILGGRDH